MNFDFLNDIWFWIVIQLICLSAIAKAVQDTLQFHFDSSVFSKLKNKQWWNPDLSWFNKYSWFPKSKILTWIISNPLVSITDAWHTFGFLRDFTMFICICIISGNWWIMLWYPIYRLIFHLFFTYIFKKRK